MAISIYQEEWLSRRVNEASHGKAMFFLVNVLQNSNFVRFVDWLDKIFSPFQYWGMTNYEKDYSFIDLMTETLQTSGLKIKVNILKDNGISIPERRLQCSGNISFYVFNNAKTK